MYRHKSTNADRHAPFQTEDQPRYGIRCLECIFAEDHYANRSFSFAWGHEMPLEDIWEIEDGFSLAWPAPIQQRAEGWLLKAGGGVSRRSNSANPTAESRPLRDVLPAIQNFYREQSLPILVRTLSVQPPAFERELVRMGFGHEGETRTLYAAKLGAGSRIGTLVESAPSAAWMDSVSSAQQRTPAEAVAFAAHVSRISLPCAFVSALDGDGEAVAWAYAALGDGRLYIESVVTRSDRRNEGHAKRALRTLIDWANHRGAACGVLQVQANNEAACHLYEGLGFTQELYRYRYWRA